MAFQPQIDCALADHRTGNLDRAESIYRQVLTADPHHPDALHLLGVLLAERGQHADAIVHIRRAIAISPDTAFFYNSLGNALRDAEQLGPAIAAYHEAVRLDSESGQAWSNLGNALREAGWLNESLQAHLKAVRLLPESAEAHNNLGIVYRQRHELPLAVAAFERAIDLRRDYPEALNNLGSARRAAGDLEAALVALLAAARLKRDSAEIFSNLGNVLKDKGRLDEAIAAQLHAAESNPRYASAFTNLAVALFETGRLDQSLAAHDQAIALMPADAQLSSNRLYSLLFHPGYLPALYRAECEKWATQFAIALAPAVPSHCNAAGSAVKGKPKRKLRVAYVSPDFRLHPVGRFMLPLLSHHDKRQFEVIAYSGVRRPDALTAELQCHCDHWQSTAAMTDEALAEQIRRDRIDILVDLTQHMADSRLLVFARRPARVQITYLGTLATTGLSAIDYRLSDPRLDPSGVSDRDYTEKTFRLSGCYWCYPAPPQAPAVRPLPPGEITFGCLNNFCKLSDTCLHLWATVLADIPDSRLVLHAHPGVHRQRVLDRFAEQQVSADRVVFSPLTTMEQYFATYGHIAIALDPFPYAGGTTTCDALWMGVPVVTLRGQTATARAGVSLLHAVGHPEWVANSPADYRTIATDLATDRPLLQHLRLTLRDQMRTSPLCDAPRFTSDMEQALQSIF